MTFRQLPVASIRTDRNVRHALGDLEDLKTSIGKHGQLQPVVVRRSGEHYTLICGHRRLAAQRERGASSVPCLIVDADAGQARVLQLVENLHRSQLTALEIVAAIDELRSETPNMTKAEAAAMLGMPETWVNLQYRAANNFDKAVAAGADPKVLKKLPTAHVIRLGIAPPEARKGIASQAVKGKWSQRQVYEAAKAARGEEAVRFASMQSMADWSGRFGIFVHDNTTLVLKLRTGDLVWMTKTLKERGGEIVAVKPIEPAGARWGKGGRGRHTGKTA